MNLDGLKRLLGMATKGAGQVAKGAAQAGQAVGKAMMPVPLQGAAKLMGKPLGQLQAPQRNMAGEEGQRQQMLNEAIGSPYGPTRQLRPQPTMFDMNRFRPDQFDVPAGFPVPGGSNTPRLYEDGSYGRDIRGGLEMPQGMPGVRLYEDGSYADRRPRY